MDNREELARTFGEEFYKAWKKREDKKSKIKDKEEREYRIICGQELADKINELFADSDMTWTGKIEMYYRKPEYFIWDDKGRVKKDTK